MTTRYEIPGAGSLAQAARLEAVESPVFAARRTERPGANPEDSAPIVLARGDGCWIEDVDGQRYLDLVAGFGALSLGHGHPVWRQAVDQQLGRLVQGLGDFYSSDVKVQLLEQLASLHAQSDARVLLCQSGADAVTAAIKTATLATGRDGLVAFDGSYHGLSYAPLAACGFSMSFRSPFAAQLSDNVQFVPYPGVRQASASASLDMLKQSLRSNKVAAVLVEPIAGRGGCVVPPPGFLREVQRLAHRYGALVVADEIWVGLGRAGRRVCSQDEMDADILCFGKGLGGGLAISACVGSKQAMRAWSQPASRGGGAVVHTSTHAGAPLNCAAALATLQILKSEGLVDRADALGQRVLGQWRHDLASCTAVMDVRGQGLMLGVELRSSALAQRVLRDLLRHGYLALSGGIGGETLTMTPSLRIDESALLGVSHALIASLERCQEAAL